jgi:hypothetical protein
MVWRQNDKNHVAELLNYGLGFYCDKMYSNYEKDVTSNFILSQKVYLHLMKYYPVLLLYECISVDFALNILGGITSVS